MRILRVKTLSPRLERGAVMVTVGLIVVVLCMITALGMETFRLLISRIQMQNIAEYIAEIALSDLRGPSAAINPARIAAVRDSNYFLAQGDGSASICVGGLNCSGSIQVTAGCYNRSTSAFTSASSSCSPPATQQAVYVRITTVGGSIVTKVLAGVFTTAQINISTSALSYWYYDDTDPLNIIQYYVTGPFNGSKS